MRQPQSEAGASSGTLRHEVGGCDAVAELADFGRRRAPTRCSAALDAQLNQRGLELVLAARGQEARGD